MNLRHKAYKPTLLTLGLICMAVVVIAQDRSTKSNTGEGGGEDSETATVIKRQPLVFEDPRSYQIPLRLEPAQSIDLIASEDGIVRSVHAKVGESLPAQGDVIRLDSTRAELLEKRARALLEARQIEVKLAESGKSADEAELAKANLEAAKAALDITQLDLERTVVRSPFAGIILKVNVVPGQFVRAGEPLAELADLTTLIARIPVDRQQVKQGGTIDIKVETTDVKGAVDSVNPPPTHFDPLRELVNSLAMAEVRIRNDNQEFHPGQAVYVNLIPEKPVSVVPAISLSNQGAGRRKIQVVREFTIRDITVDPLAQIGSERIFVSGDFSPGDEVIVSSTTELTDGTLLRPWSKEYDDPKSSKAEDSKSDQRKKSNKGP